MSKRRFKFYTHHGTHLNLPWSGDGKRTGLGFGRFFSDVIFGVCFKVGSPIYSGFSSLVKKLHGDYRDTAELLVKRLHLAKQPQFARALVIFVLAAGLSFSGLFAASLLARALEFKTALLNAGQQGSQALLAAKSGLQSNDFTSAQGEFLRAYRSFTDGPGELEKQNRFLTQLLELLPQKRDSDQLFKAAALLSEAGTQFTAVYEQMSNLGISQSGFAGPGKSGPDLAAIDNQLRQAVKKVDSAMGLLDTVNADSLPGGYREKFIALKGNFTSLQRAFRSFSDLSSLGAGLLAGDKRILLVLENNNELRPAGGFIGTFGDIKSNNGVIQAVNMSSIYDLDGQLREKIRPPFPIFAVNNRWFLRDSNWFASWPESAKKISDFYEKEGGETPDQIVAMTPSLIQNLLKLTGPLPLPRYNVTLTAENFVEVAQVQASVLYNQVDNKPKQILADMVPVLLGKLGALPKQQWPQLLQAFQDSLNQKHLALYSRDQKVEDKILAFNWGGDIRASDRDYLQVNSANLSGSKTDLYIKQSLRLKTVIDETGGVVDELTITRTNTMPNLPDTGNTSFVRVFAPEGSVLLANSGFDYNTMPIPSPDGYKIDRDVSEWEKGITKDVVSGTSVGRESGKTFFGNWLTVKGGETKTVTLSYRLPFKLGYIDHYSLLLQKQAGSLAQEISYDLRFASRSLLWKNFDPNQLEAGSLSSTFAFDKDCLLGEVLQKQP